MHAPAPRAHGPAGTRWSAGGVLGAMQACKPSGWASASCGDGRAAASRPLFAPPLAAAAPPPASCSCITARHCCTQNGLAPRCPTRRGVGRQKARCGDALVPRHSVSRERTTRAGRNCALTKLPAGCARIVRRARRAAAHLSAKPRHRQRAPITVFRAAVPYVALFCVCGGGWVGGGGREFWTAAACRPRAPPGPHRRKFACAHTPCRPPPPHTHARSAHTHALV